MPEASERSVTSVSSDVAPDSRQVSQSCGRATAATRSAWSGSVSRQPAQLGDREGGDGDGADGVGPRAGAGLGVAVAQLGDEVGRPTAPTGCRSTAAPAG